MNDRQNLASIYMNGVQRHTVAQIRGKIESHEYDFQPRSCAICRCDSFEKIADSDRFGLPLYTVLCKGCGLLQASPTLREEDYSDFYRQHFYNLHHGEIVSPEDFFSLQKQRGAFILKYVRNAGLKPGALVLEVGCGPGGILSVFETAGFEVIGLDFETEYLKCGREKGLDLRNGRLQEITLSRKPDLVIYSHVLEHLLNPRLELEYVSDALAKNGMVYAEAPGLFYLATAYLGDLRILLQFPHLQNFHLGGLRNLFESSGFEFIQGDESVRAIFRAGVAAKEIQSHYDEVSVFLRALNEQRNGLLWRMRRGLYLFALKWASILGCMTFLRKIYWSIQLLLLPSKGR